MFILRHRTIIEGGIWACLLCCLCLDPAALNPAQQPESPSAPERAVIRVQTRLVQVTVVVQDRKGEPVSGLTKDDFTLLDGGQPQTISFFSQQSDQVLPEGSAPVPPSTYSNRPQRRGGVPASVSVIVIDELNTDFGDLAYARQQLVKFLLQIQPQDHVALYALGRQLRILHDFTTDSRRLVGVLARYNGQPSGELDASQLPPQDESPLPNGQPRHWVREEDEEDLDRYLGRAFEQESDSYTEDRVKVTLRAMEAIANQLAGLPGRKNLIWVSDSFPFAISMGYPILTTREQRTFSDEIGRTRRAVNDANVAIYPVDARGLEPMKTVNDPVPHHTNPRSPRRVIVPSDPLGDLHLAQASMQALADGTGGRAFSNTDDIQGAIRAAFDDSRLTYVLGYYPTHNKWNGKFREIKVEVKRPGVRLRYRRGYFAMGGEGATHPQREAAMRDVLWSPLDASGLGLTVRIRPSETPAANALDLHIMLDPHDITLEQQGDRWAGSLDILVAGEDKVGKQLGNLAKTFDLHLTQANHDRVVKWGLSVDLRKPVDPSTSQLRVVVRDNPSGGLGSVTIPLGPADTPAGSR